MEEKRSVRIRFNTNYKEHDTSTKEWRVLIDGIENFCNKVIINCPSYTSRDHIEGIGTKWHISCEPTKITFLKDEKASGKNFYREIILE